MIAAGAALNLAVEVWHDDGAASNVVDDETAPRIDPDQAIAMHRAWRQSSAGIDTSHLLPSAPSSVPARICACC